MFENEEWAPIEEFPHYLISTHGRVKHVDRNNARTVTINERGFPVVQLASDSTATRYMRQINTLVAKAFLPPPLYDNMTSVWHKDGDLTNCHVSNLMWDTRPRVLEWNEMHRSGKPKFSTSPVKNNRTGVTYANAYECAMAEGTLESTIIWRIERQASHIYDDTARYRYVP